MAFNTAAAYASGFDSGKYGFKSLGEAGLLSEDGKALAGSVQAANQALAGNLAAKALGIEGDLKEREMVNDVLMATLEQTAKEKKNNLLVNLMTGGKSGGSSSLLSGLNNYNAVLGGLPGGGFAKDPIGTVNKWNEANKASDPYSGLYKLDTNISMPTPSSQVDLSKATKQELLKALQGKF
jgi:hypothetical protein